MERFTRQWGVVDALVVMNFVDAPPVPLWSQLCRLKAGRTMSEADASEPSARPQETLTRVAPDELGDWNSGWFGISDSAYGYASTASLRW